MEFQAANPLLMSHRSVTTFFGSDVDSDGRIVFNLLSHLYAAMLLTFSSDQIRRFWERLPLERNGVQLQGLPKYRLVLKEPSKVPLGYQLRMLEAVRPFCREEGIDADALFQNFFSGIYPWRHLSAKAWLGMVEPLLDGLFSDPDPRAFILRHFEQLQTRFYPHSTHDVIRDVEKTGIRTTTLIYSLDNSTFVPFDYETWLLPWLVRLPTIFGLPPVEEAELVADVRTIAQILPEGSWHRRRGVLYYGKKGIGKGCSFSAVARQLEMPPEDPFDLTSECDLIEEDVVDDSGRVVLRAGCCYGAPAYLVRLRYAVSPPVTIHPLRPLLQGLFRDDDLSRARLNDLHEAYLTEIAHTAKIVFYRKDDSVSIDGQHFIRNVPAKIFRKVIRAYLLEKRTEFENREFKRDPEITLDLVNPNFEGRLNRLMAKLSDDRPDLQIVRHKRGAFSFIPKCAIDYREE